MGFKSIFDPSFQYRNAVSTDIRKTFERIRRQQQKEEAPEQARQEPGKLLMLPAQRRVSNGSRTARCGEAK